MQWEYMVTEYNEYKKESTMTTVGENMKLNIESFKGDMLLGLAFVVGNKGWEMVSSDSIMFPGPTFEYRITRHWYKRPVR